MIVKVWNMLLLITESTEVSRFSPRLLWRFWLSRNQPHKAIQALEAAMAAERGMLGRCLGEYLQDLPLSTAFVQHSIKTHLVRWVTHWDPFDEVSDPLRPIWWGEWPIETRLMGWVTHWDIFDEVSDPLRPVWWGVTHLMKWVTHWDPFDEVNDLWPIINKIRSLNFWRPKKKVLTACKKCEFGSKKLRGACAGKRSYVSVCVCVHAYMCVCAHVCVCVSEWWNEHILMSL